MSRPVKLWGKKITHPKPSNSCFIWNLMIYTRISSISTKWASLLPTKTSCFFPENVSHLGEPQHFLLRSTARVEFPHLRTPAVNGCENPRWWRDFHRDWVNTIYWDPYRAIITQKMSDFFFQPGLLVFLLVPLVPVIRRRQSGILPKWQISLNLTIIRLKVCMANWLISCGNALILVTQHSIHDLLWSMLHHLPSWKNPQPNVFQSLFHPTKRNGHESNFAD